MRFGGPTVTVVNDGWFAHNTQGQVPASATGAKWRVNAVQCRGLYVVPPGGAFNFAVVKASSASNPQFCFLRWHEVQLHWKS